MALIQPHILIFEPGIKGHHLSWLRFITEDFLQAGFQVTAAVDLRPEYRTLIEKQLSSLLSEISVISAFDEHGKWRKGDKVKAIADCLTESGAHEVFMNNLDEIASHCLRLAAFGIFPPKLICGRLSGVYFRPRFLNNPYFPPGNLIKTIGFRRLIHQGWFKNIYLLDEYLFAKIKTRWSGLFHFLPDIWNGNFSHKQSDARKELGIPDDRFIFLHYGIGDRRKGLHLIGNALSDLSHESRFFLLCAGQMSKDKEINNKMLNLETLGRAKLINRFVSDREEELCFCASDVVLLPYIQHFGSSGVLSRACAAGKVVIVSDENLLARRVNEHNLGWTFSSGNCNELRKKMEEASLMSRLNMEGFRQSALAYASSCSREMFRNHLLLPYNEKNRKSA